MKYYSTNHKAPLASLQQAVEQGLALDRGLYMPERLNQLPDIFFEHIDNMSFQELSFEVARALFGEDVDEDDLRRIVYDTLSFETPVVKVRDNIYALELFHGPTLAFKDVGARFMARLLQYFIRKDHSGTTSSSPDVNVLVATSGDTGSAVANGFLGVDGIHVYVLYPKGKVSHIQESQFTTLGQNVTALEVDGVFDDCQALVKSAFMDDELKRHMTLTSANSINVARFLEAQGHTESVGRCGGTARLEPCFLRAERQFRQYHGWAFCCTNGPARCTIHCCQQCQQRVLQLSADRHVRTHSQQTDHRQRHGRGCSKQFCTHH